MPQFPHGSLRAALAFALLAGCAGPAPPDNTRLKVVGTTGIVADTVSRVGAERIEVQALMGPGVDPHLYKASEGDLRRLDGADLIFYNGLHLEGKMGDILEKMARVKPVAALGDRIPQDQRRQSPEFAGLYDPHIWFDVSLWSYGVEVAAAELAARDPAHAGEYRDNAARYCQELEQLDAWVKQKIASIPPERRVLVTAHDAFGYFGRRYGIEVVAIQGISTLAEAGLRDLERVIDLVSSRRIPALFIESSVPRRSIEAVQEACRLRGHEVRIGGELYSDALGAPGTPAATYAGMVRANVETIVAGLGGAGER